MEDKGMIVRWDDVREDGVYRRMSVRAALHKAVSDLDVGQSITIEKVIKPDGSEVPVREFQIQIRQVIPEGWDVMTRSCGNGLKVVRVD